MELRTLSDEEFLRHANAVADSLTDTDIQREALRRLEQKDPRENMLEGFIALINDYDVTVDGIRTIVESHPASEADMAKLLSMLNDQDIHTPDQLKKLIDWMTQFHVLANDAGDVFTRITQLINETQGEK